MEKMLSGLAEWIREIISKTVSQLVELELERREKHLLINREEVVELLGIGKTLFDNEYRHSRYFPKELPGCRWSRLAVIEWDKKYNK